MGIPAAPTPASLVAAELLSYLRLRKGLSVRGYLQPPETVPEGWEAYTYRLHLLGRRLPTPLRRPLALRVYACAEGLPRLRRDWAWQRWLSGLQYPVARPVLREEDCGFLGGPFLLMEWVEGDVLLDRLFRDYLTLLWAPARMAETHARLHKLPVPEMLRPERPFLDRELEALRADVEDCDLAGLAPGVDWLHSHRPPNPEAPCLLHVDFHPKNLLMRKWRCAAVLDWSEADVGDRHADVGASLVLMDTVPVEESAGWDRMMEPIGRWLLRRWYLMAYRKLLPLDPDRLRYYQAWAALRRLTRYGRWLRIGPHVMGYKPDAEKHIRPGHVADLERYFERHSGVAVRLGVALPAE